MFCKGLEINIDRSDNNYFILEEDIKEMFFNMGYHADSQQLSEVDIRKIEQQVNNVPSAFRADAYTTIDGKVKIDIKQRKPILRVFLQSGQSFYMDEDGWLMPLSANFTAHVLVASGNIETEFARVKNAEKDSSGILKDLFSLAKYINENEFWKGQIIQLFVNTEEEIELIPRVGNHTIVLGDISDMNEKFEKLMIFYKKGLPKVGWNEYSQINLKFKNQVVCKKN